MFSTEIIDEDAPDCIEASPDTFDSVNRLEIKNYCDEIFTMQALECDACQEEFELDAPEVEGEYSRGRLDLEQRKTTELADGQTDHHYTNRASATSRES